MSFLKAEWSKLAIANYIIDPKVLDKYVPPGTELDLWNGNCYVSLVGFMFKNTRILGIKVPFHINFEEVNLRFYVKRFEMNEWKRGVVFIKEIVPKPALSFVANTVYKEHYETLPMQHKWEDHEKTRVVQYQWRKNDLWQSFEVKAELEPQVIVENSETEFITEHYWGYAKTSETTSNEYEVTHPRWEHYPVIESNINVDYGLVYGEEFNFINELSPSSVMLAEGSNITVEGKRKIKV